MGIAREGRGMGANEVAEMRIVEGIFYMLGIIIVYYHSTNIHTKLK